MVKNPPLNRKENIIYVFYERRIEEKLGSWHGHQEPPRIRDVTQRDSSFNWKFESKPEFKADISKRLFLH